MAPDDVQNPATAHAADETTVSLPRDPREEGAFVDDTGLFLIAIDGPAPGRAFALAEHPISAGRDAHLEIVVEDTRVSRVHFLASVVNDRVVVEDLRSTNGTFIDGRRISSRAALPVGSILRIGDRSFRCERCRRAELSRLAEERRDLERAARYVHSLLPAPVTEGPVRAEWLLVPSSRLGGDALGYRQLDDQTFVMFLIDVSGHGTRAAMHSVSVLNVLRQAVLPHADFRRPVQVLECLNAMFQMDRHDDQYFTIWYGVYDLPSRTLTYASGGHHPAFLADAARHTIVPLRTPGTIIGAIPEARFMAASVRVAAGAALYLFSDGAFEVVTPQGPWELADFVRLLSHIPDRRSECHRLHNAVVAASRPGPLDDDLSLLVVTFL